METTNLLKEKITHKEWLTKFRNDWTAKLLANVIDLEHGKKTKEANPQYAETLQNGQVVSISQIIRLKITNIEEAKGYIEMTDMLLKAEDEGKLEEYWEEYKPFLQKVNIIKPDINPLSFKAKK